MLDQPSIPPFPHGLRVFLRSQMPDGSLHNVDFPLGRSIATEERAGVWTILGEGGTFLGAFSQDSFSFVLPLVPVGPGPSDAKN